MSIAQRERAALVDTMRTVGPEAPTLCDGWNVRDLAAHLMIREYRLDASPGILIPFFAGHTEKVQNDVAQHTDWDELLREGRLRSAGLFTAQAARPGGQCRRDVHPPRGRPSRPAGLGAPRA